MPGLQKWCRYRKPLQPHEHEPRFSVDSLGMTPQELAIRILEPLDPMSPADEEPDNGKMMKNSYFGEALNALWARASTHSSKATLARFERNKAIKVAVPM